MFCLRISSILLKSFLQVPMFLLIPLSPNGSSVLFSVLFFSIPILSVVTHVVTFAASYSKEISSITFYLWIVLMTPFTFPTSALNFAQSHDLTDYNPSLWSKCITTGILSKRTSSSGFTVLCSSLAGELLASSAALMLSSQPLSSLVIPNTLVFFLDIRSYPCGRGVVNLWF